MKSNRFKITLTKPFSTMTVELDSKNSETAKESAKFWEINGYKISLVELIGKTEDSRSLKVLSKEEAMLRFKRQKMYERQRNYTEIVCKECKLLKKCSTDANESEFHHSLGCKTGFLKTCKECVRKERQDYHRNKRKKGSICQD